MQLAGLQRCSLVDYPGQPCCTVFTQGCNLRCPWCHNARLIGSHAVDPVPEDEFWGLLHRRRGRVGAVTVSGGEPTLHGDLAEFLATIKSLGFSVKLDTNGTRPDVLENLIQEYLVDHVAMDVKAPLDERYETAAGAPVSVDAVRESIAVLRRSNWIGVEFRTTVVPLIHSEDDIAEIAQDLIGSARYFLQSFESDEALNPQYRKSPPPTREFMRGCRERASQWIETTIR